MDLRYFFDQTLLEDSSLRILVPYNATGAGYSGYFLNNDSRTTTAVGTHYVMTGTSNLEDFTLMVTYTKENFTGAAVTGAANTGAMKLFSNFAQGTGGWTLGVNEANFLFIHAPLPSPCSYTFDQITLGKKNCIALQKQGMNFSIYNFSPYSERIEESQTVVFEPYSLLSGSNFKAGGDGYPNNNFLPGVAYLRGTMDQYAIIDQAVDQNTLLTLFSGFAPYNITTLTTTGTKLVSSVFSPESGFAQMDYNFMSGAAALYSNTILTGAVLPGLYDGRIVFTLGSYPTYNAANYIGSENFCSTGYTLLSSAGIVYTGFSPLGTGNVIFSKNTDGQYSFQYSFAPRWNATLTQVYQSGVVTTGYSKSLDTGYYPDFYLYGVTETEGESTILANYTNRTGLVGAEGVYDSSSGYFKLPLSVSGQLIWFDGIAYSGTGYGYNNSYIDIPNYNETSADYVIYDTPGGQVVFQHFNVNEFATGQFHLSHSVVFTGTNSFSYLQRISESNYLETHPLHLYHGKDLPEATGLSVYDNNDLYWI